MRSLINKVHAMINRCVVTNIDNGTKNPLWVVKGVVDQDKQVEVFENYGRTAIPPEDAEALRFALEGDESHCIAMGATGGNHRPVDGLPGEVIDYAMWENLEDEDNPLYQRIHYKEDKQSINILSGKNNLIVDNEKISGDVDGNTLTLNAAGFSVDVGGNTVTLTDSKLTFSVGGNTFTMDASGFKGDKDAEFDDVSVATHKHSITGSPPLPI